MTVLASSSAAASVSKPLQLRGPEGAKPRLLLAEDSDPVRIVTAAMLKGMGCVVEAVVHGEQAVSQAAEQQFDVIVLDIEMPVMDGITAAKSIRRMGGPAGDTPLMALSAFLADSVRTGEWRDTFDIALPKPTSRSELHGAISTALSWQQRRTTGGAETRDLPLVDIVELQSLRAGLTDDIWEELRDLACRDIEVCTRQLEHAVGSSMDEVVLTFSGKLASLGRTFAAPRLSHIAQHVQIEGGGLARQRAVVELLAISKATVAALRV